MKNLGSILGIITTIAICIELLCLFVSFTLAQPGVPGDKIVILGNETIMFEGKPCRTNLPAFISPIGPDGENYWVMVERWIFPFGSKISVIYPSGSKGWVPSSQIRVVPADTDLLLCPTE